MKLFTVEFETDQGVYNGIVIAEGETEAITLWKAWAQKTYFGAEEELENCIGHYGYGRPEATEWVIDVPGPARALNWKDWQPFDGEYH